jgi:hypothetical protein
VAPPGVDAFLRRHVAGFLQEAGYVKDRRVYRSVGGDGATSIIGFAPVRFAPPSLVTFVVQAGVHLPVARPWLSAELQAEVAGKPIGVEDAQYAVALLPPAEFSLQEVAGVPGRDAWVIPAGLADGSAVAGAVREGLRERVFPLLVRALGGERDADVFRDPALNVIAARKPFTRPAVWN